MMAKSVTAAMMVALSLGFLLLPVSRARADWINLLRRQARQDVRCEIAVMTNIVDHTEGDRRFNEALVYCVDGRRFVAYRAVTLGRPAAKTPFRLRNCRRERGC